MFLKTYFIFIFIFAQPPARISLNGEKGHQRVAKCPVRVEP